MDRISFLKLVRHNFAVNPVVAILGPRQCGKTTLAKAFAEKTHKILYLDLEKPEDLAILESPMLVLRQNFDLVVIDEIQRRPELFPILRVIVDETERKRKFLILGSASRDLINQSSETLAGRISFLELTPFSLEEVKEQNTLWLRGGFPLSFLASSDEISNKWRADYITTFLERDIPQLGFNIPSIKLRRFWMMLSHYHGNILNASEIATSMQISYTSVKNYLDILTGTFMVRQLLPWFVNINKRQIKSPKIFFRDSGLLHTLLYVNNNSDLLCHPKLGASWEGFAIEEIIRKLKLSQEECFFWGVHSQADLDLLVFRNGQKIGFEIKYTDSPQITKSIKISMDILGLDKLYIIYPGEKNFPLSEKIFVSNLVDFCIS